MIVRNLPSISKRWSPQKTQNKPPQKPKHHNSQNNVPQNTQSKRSWRHKPKQNSINNNRQPQQQQPHQSQPKYMITSKNNNNNNTTPIANRFKWKVATKGGFRKGQINQPPAPNNNISNKPNPQRQRKWTNASNTSNINASNNVNTNTYNNKPPNTPNIRKSSNLSNISRNNMQNRKHSNLPNAPCNNMRKSSNASNINPPHNNYANGYNNVRKSSNASRPQTQNVYRNNNVNRQYQSPPKIQQNNYNQRKVSNTSNYSNGYTPNMRQRQHSNAAAHSQQKPSNIYANTSIRKTSDSYANNGYQSPRKRKPTMPMNLPSPIHIPGNVPTNNRLHSTQSSSSGSSNQSRKHKDDARRLYELFARDKLIKWIEANVGKYEPIFVVLEHYGVKDEIIGRDTSGHYKLYNKRNVIESPPYEQNLSMVHAVEELLKGYQLRFKATSLRKQKTVQVITRSKGNWVSSSSVHALFTKVVDFGDKSGNVTNVLLQDAESGTTKAFPIQNVKENLMLSIETNDKLFVGKEDSRRGSYTQYVTPSYWLNSDEKVNAKSKTDEVRKEKTEKQQRALLEQISRMNKETRNLQEGIMHKLKLIDSFDLNAKDKGNRTGMAALRLLWTEVLKQNKSLRIKTKLQQMQIDNWKQIAIDNTKENRLLKQQISKVKDSLCDRKITKTESDTKTNSKESTGNAALQRKLKFAMADQNAKDKKIRSLQLEITDLKAKSMDVSTKQKQEKVVLQRKLKTAMDGQTAKEQKLKSLQQQITKLRSEAMTFKAAIKPDTKTNATESLQRKLKMLTDDQKLNEQTIRKVQSENAMLKKKLTDLVSEQKTSVSAAPSSNSEKLHRGGGFAVNSTFLTVKEVLSEYQSLRDQEYHNLHCELKKCLKDIKAKSWHKLYINQTCHRFMFETLHLCYKAVRKYGDSIYQSVGGTLCIQQVTNNKAEQDSKMNYVFHFYLQENHQILFNNFTNKHMDTLIDKAKKIYNKQTQTHLGVEAYVLITRYLAKCCRICWLMYLQQPKVTLYPKEFKPVLKSVAFDAAQHSKTMGSDRKSSFILYYVWPTVKRGNERLEMNVQVIIRDTDVPMNKRRK